MRDLRGVVGERGIAMVTVLLVGAVLTAVSSVAAFATINELRASLDDRKASEAVAIAEAGIDRMLEYIRSGEVTWNDIRFAGCTVDGITYPPVRVEAPAEEGSLGNNRWFGVELTIYDIDGATAAGKLPPDACAGRTSAINGETDLFFAITSEGHHPTATRVLRQLIVISAVELPVGIFADRADANGSPSMNTISLISRTVISGREKISFVGNDPYYTLGKFWPDIDESLADDPKPAAAHALGPIYLKGDNQTNQVEHKPGQPLNCTANGSGTAGQSQWDQSGDGDTITTTTPCAAGQGAPPPTSKFTADDLTRVTPNPELTDQDYFALRETAKRTGLYCLFRTDGTQDCRKGGQSWTFSGTVQDADVNAITDPPTSNRTFVAYFEYENPANRLTSNLVHFKGEVSPCSNDPAINQFMVLVVRNGSFQTEGSGLVNGFFMIPEGIYGHQGTATINGTIIAERFENLGNGSFQLDECWVNNVPGPFLDISPFSWMEIDR